MQFYSKILQLNGLNVNEPERSEALVIHLFKHSIFLIFTRNRSFLIINCNVFFSLRASSAHLIFLRMRLPTFKDKIDKSRIISKTEDSHSCFLCSKKIIVLRNLVEWKYSALVIIWRDFTVWIFFTLLACLNRSCKTKSRPFL